MEGFAHSDTHINFAIHGEDRESEINIEGGEVEAQEIGAVNDGGQRVQSGTPAFGIGAGNDEQVPAVAAAPGFPIGAFNYRVWQEPDDEYMIDDSEAPGFGIEAGNGVDWPRHGVWPETDEEYIIDDGGAPGFGIEAGNDVDWPVHLGGGPVHPGGGRMHGVWPMHPGYLGGGPVHLGGYPGDGPVHPGGGPVHPGLVHPGGGPMHGVWPVNLGGGLMHRGGVPELGGPMHGVRPVNLGGGPMHPGGVPELGGPMHGVWSMHLAGPVYLGPQEHGIPNLPHLFPDDFEEGEIPDDFEEGEIPDFTIGINEEAVNGVKEILERVCESVEIDELAVEQGEDCAICLEALNHVEDDDNGNRTLHRLPCSHLFHSLHFKMVSQKPQLSHLSNSTSAAVATGGTYTVGGTQGWGFSSYSKWLSKAPRFKAGDIMNFKYIPNSHDVVAVGSNDFKSCRVTGRAKRYTSGNDNIALKKGWNYFICGFPGHCAGGMRVAIKAI